jgi:AcrR family transcriptional regulator
VRRHFPSRQTLLEAVFRQQVDALAARAGELAASADPRAALLDWLAALTSYAATARGLATALIRDDSTAEHAHACSVTMVEAGKPLVYRAIEAGAVGPDVTPEDLIAVVTGIVLATEHSHDPAGEAQRLLALAVRGISP